ncbi:MAG TPA: c-type cytochrome biogenesis protein CcmI [Hyphomicrobiaceae bacterium]|nr:c-type cytochrome biogenesis protein CcmI [Hyphomicrobiaceae bacterium]
MLLWLGFAVLTAAVVAALLRPLFANQAPEVPVPGASAAVYRDQLAEIASEEARGLIGAAEAEAARVEIARRLLATADRASGEQPASSSREVRSVATVLAAALPVLAVVVYLAVGTPGLPGQPFAARSPDGQSVGQLVAKVEARLRAHPEDGRGWDVIAPVYLRLGRYHEAAEAFQQALRLVGESADRLAGLAEAHVLANDGHVSEVARKAYERLRVLTPERVEPRFWLAVVAEQEGRFEEAVKAYAQLLTEGSAAAPWRASVVERWKAVRTKLGLATDPVPDGVAESKPTGLAPALAREDVRAIQALPADERQRMIEDMVAGLDKQLAENGRDLEGWQRLIRAYTVLGRREDALGALARARSAFAEETQALDALSTLARTLGLAS